MSSHQTPEGVEALTFILGVIRPVVQEHQSLTAKKGVAYTVFKVGKDWPASRIDEAFDKRCKAPTLNLIIKRARELGLGTDESPWKQEAPASNDTLLTNLLSAQATIYARHKDTSHPEFIAIAEAVRRLG